MAEGIDKTGEPVEAIDVSITEDIAGPISSVNTVGNIVLAIGKIVNIDRIRTEQSE